MKFDFRVSNQIFKPTFGKIELGTVSVRKNDGGMEDVKLVEYESDDVADIKQLKGVQNSWNVKARFINNIMTAFLEDNCDNIYGLENSDGDTLVLADVCNMQYYGTRKEYCGSPCINIDLIQVNPIEKYLSTDESKKRYKGLGEAMVSEIAKIAKDEGVNFINTTSANEGFWVSSGLFDIINPDMEGGVLPDRMLPSSKYDDYIKYVEDKKAKHANKAGMGLNVSV